MVTVKVKIKNSYGLHLRPAKKLCQKVQDYPCEILMQVRGNYYNVKSMLQVLAAGVKPDEEIELICKGDEEETVLENLKIFIEEELCESIED
ncbi:MAG: HPr family phosphocarrier protein [Lachnospiraceae bacterium]|nr:HPr family phosphocarrier protein [Lachnospiraceae bacterium]